MTKHQRIMAVIGAVKAAHADDWEEYYTLGHCYEMFLILKSCFPEAKAWTDQSHVATWIDGKLYDITGIVEDTKHYGPASERDHKSYGLRFLTEDVMGMIHPDYPDGRYS